MTQRLFKRSARLSIAKHDLSIAPTNESGQYFRHLPGISIENLRIVFEAERNSNKEPNTARIMVYNLAPNSRALVQEAPLFVRLEAGYDGNLATICEGDVTWARSTRIDTGWETTLELGEGARAYQHARLSKSYKKGTKIKDVIKDLSKSMGLPDPKNQAAIKNLADQYASGHAISGPSEKALTETLQRHGLSWTIDAGQIRIRKRSEPFEASAILISQSTGMMGVPELGRPEKKGKPPTLTVRQQLNAEIRCGSLIKLESRNLNGNYVVQQVNFRGDTHGSDWYTEVEATPR